MNPFLGRNFEALDPLEWLARMSDHIPDPGQHRTLFYGEYANRVRGARRPELDGAKAPADPPPGRCSPSWARLIAKVYQMDPLVCTRCGQRMSIVAFVTDFFAIRRILDHLGLSPQPQDKPPPIREVLRVPSTGDACRRGWLRKQTPMNKLSTGDSDAVRARVAAGEDVVSFDLRGVGETRMRYRASSGDDPTLAEADEARAYFNPLSGVLANHVYNSLLVGRPYFLEMIEDVEIVRRFARETLGIPRLAVAVRRGERARGGGGAERLERAHAAEPPRFRWSDVVEEMREVWPIQYLLPGGALGR
jgi:hypothetical protein